MYIICGKWKSLTFFCTFPVFLYPKSVSKNLLIAEKSKAKLSNGDWYYKDSIIRTVLFTWFY